ncbi:MAG: deoxyribodipyrimidine photo-lyase [Bacteroidota bacterium]
MATLLWYRKDLRLTDHPALHAAIDRGEPVIPVFLWTPDDEGEWAPGEAHQWYLHHSLDALGEQLDAVGSKLIIRQGSSALSVLRDLIEETGATAVYWSRHYTPPLSERDATLSDALIEDGIEVQAHKGQLLFEPGDILTGNGDIYKVYTPFWKKLKSRQDEIADPLPSPTSIPAPGSWPESAGLAGLDLLPTNDWAAQFTDYWTAGESDAQDRLDAFIRNGIEAYETDRDKPAIDGTSRLSPRFHLGELSPRYVWDQVRTYSGPGQRSKGVETFLKEIVWREFSYHLLYAHPETPLKPLKEKYEAFPWAEEYDAPLERWQRGETGYPIVDAGMRQLWAVGWMHNRVRMIVASFLIKDLLIPWQEGALWFWDCLVDADLASNTQGWQWTAGSGADASPFFRVFNPVSQGERYDPNGDYVREWVPELADLPKKLIHKPWEATDRQLADAGITLGETYPEPMVNHAQARERALEALKQI